MKNFPALAGAALLVALFLVCPLPAALTAQQIIQRSAEANQRDWQADPQYAYTETDLEKDVRKTYEVTMIEGSPYRRLVAVNGQPLSADEQKRYNTRSKPPRVTGAENRRANAPSESASIAASASVTTCSCSNW